MNRKVGLICTRGLPARYGAFEETVANIIRFAEHLSPSTIFYVGTDSSLRGEDFSNPNCVRVFAPRFDGLGVLLYGIASAFQCLFRGCRTLCFFGYGLAPLFPILRAFGIGVVCNVDGFEWRRAKWGKFPRLYFGLCESICGKTGISVVADSDTVRRYYRIKYGKDSHLIRYGSDLDKNVVEARLGAGPPISAPYCVVVMRMEPENNINMIVDGFLQSNCLENLVLIGPSTKYFEDKVLPKVISSPRIKYLGPIYDRKELARMRANAALYIHGHSVGGTNPTLVEACFLKSPIFAFDTRFNREVLNRNAKYFRNSADLAECLDDSNDLTPVPVLGPEYDWKVIVKQYLKLFGGG